MKVIKNVNDVYEKACPPWISKLKYNQIFVFGSNEAGIHGAGAALMAAEWGARDGQGFGPSGRTFAIPTKDWRINTLTRISVSAYVNRFVEFAMVKSLDEFLVTEIGCGLAGFTPEEMAPLFINAFDLDNVRLPVSFIEILMKEK